MRDVYTAKLSRLSDEILEMGNLCGQAIMKTCQLLASVEIREAATKEIVRIEKEIDDKEHNIEALCMQLLLKAWRALRYTHLSYQPNLPVIYSSVFLFCGLENSSVVSL